MYKLITYIHSFYYSASFFFYNLMFSKISVSDILHLSLQIIYVLKHLTY